MSFSAPNLTFTPLSQDNFADLELLDYWHRHSIPANPSDHDPVRLGFSHHYLLSGILALAALQLFDEDRSQTRWYVRAVTHRQAAITQAAPHFQRLDKSHHQALLSFSFYTSMYTLAEPILRPAAPGCLQPNFDPVDELLQAIRLGRSSTVFVQQHLTSAVSSDPFLVAKYNPRRLVASQGLESAFPQLAWLRSFIERHCQGEEKAVCLDAAESLFVSIDRLVNHPDGPTQICAIGAIWGWASNVSSTFLDLCSAQNTAALVVFAHFAVLMSLGRGNWYLQSWPTVLISHIRGLLKGELEDAVRWPEEVIFGNRVILPSLLSTA
ncbi:hypothetical protein F66182_3058 [Fusarium sp. NRRL 66182]|nr:hypothetical protein F66182_3058 [Fusarium sp. NRRL 66182]